VEEVSEAGEGSCGGAPSWWRLGGVGGREEGAKGEEEGGEVGEVGEEGAERETRVIGRSLD
jgi:hypothetical protein